MIGSLSVLASALDSLLDCGISTANLFSVRKAEEPPDLEHSFGHGKAESLAVLMEGTLIAGSGLWLATRAAAHLAEPRPLSGYGLGAAAMVLSLLVSLGLSRFLVRRAEETGSALLRADSVHYASDVWTSGGVLAAIGLQALTGKPWIDPVFSLAVAVGILWQVRPVLRQAIDELMDRELSREERSRIEAIVQRYAPVILDFHRLRTRRAGPQRTVNVHVVICKERPFEEAHAVVNSLEQAIRAEVPNADVMVHADPCSSAPVICPGPHRRSPAGEGRGGERAGVYYESVEELPYEVRRSLPHETQEAYLRAFNEEYALGANPESAAAEARRRVGSGPASSSGSPS